MVIEQRKIQDVEGLSEIIIETLKKLSSEQQPLSVTFLSRALSKRGEVREMMESTGNRTGRDVAEPAAVQAKPVETQGSGRSDKTPDLSLKAAIEEHEKILRMEDFLRRSTATLASLASRGATGAEVSERLSDFRRMVLEGSAIGDLEKGLERLGKSIRVISEDDLSHDADAGTSRNMQRYGAGDQRDSSSLDPRTIPGVRSIISAIVAEFDQDLGEDYVMGLSKLRKNLVAEITLDDLPEVEHNLVAIIRAYHRKINEERNQITDFISEIGTSLLEIEEQFSNSMANTEYNQTVQNSINGLIMNHMEEMKSSAQLSTTLAEFKSLVVSRLASIRDALEQKRRAEEQREESLHGELENLQKNLKWMKKEIDQVQEKRKALEKEVLIDHLTGIANRRSAKRRLKDEIQRFHRYGQFFSLVVFDIDHFKSVNDHFGHWAGDKVLRELIKRVKPMLRETDFIGRWGGEEFVIIFPGTEIESAVRVSERLRKTVENTRFLYNKQEIAVTVSIGVTEVKSEDATLEAVFTRTDKAMYDAKKGGRNMVVTA